MLIVNDFTKWIDVVTDPLGIAGFALFLVFALLALIKIKSENRLLLTIFIVMAFTALIGGLGLSFLKIHKQHSPANTPHPVTETQPTNQTIQNTRGVGNPAISDIEGDVTINVNTVGKE